MPLDARELDRRIKQLRKSLQGVAKDPTVDEVHDLRTRTRRVESILQALEMDARGNARKLLKGLKSVRKQAGMVRDMDVLTSYIVGLGLEDDSGCVVRLVHHLGIERYRHARKLYSTVNRIAPQLRRRLKLSRRRLEKLVERFAETRAELDRKKKDGAEGPPVHAMSVALRISRELASVRRLGPNNLHPYRLEVKRLRYVLEMADGDDGNRKPLIDQLTQVQDAIGEWHDWVELGAIARDVVGQHRSCKLIAGIEDTAQKKYREALRITEEMRRRYLPVAKAGKQRRPAMPGPVLVAASEIAA